MLRLSMGVDLEATVEPEEEEPEEKEEEEKEGEEVEAEGDKDEEKTEESASTDEAAAEATGSDSWAHRYLYSQYACVYQKHKMEKKAREKKVNKG